MMMNTDHEEFRQWLSDTRRNFHMHPEVSHQETRTTDKIADILLGLGREVQEFDDMTGRLHRPS